MGRITEGFLEGIQTIGLSETEKIYLMNKMGESTSKALGDFKDNALRSDNLSVTGILDNTTYSFSSKIDSSGVGTSSYGEGNSGYIVGLMNNLGYSLDNQSVDESLKNNIKLSLVGLSKIDKTGFDNSEYETASKKMAQDTVKNIKTVEGINEIGDGITGITEGMSSAILSLSEIQSSSSRTTSRISGIDKKKVLKTVTKQAVTSVSEIEEVNLSDIAKFAQSASQGALQGVLKDNTSSSGEEDILSFTEEIVEAGITAISDIKVIFENRSEGSQDEIDADKQLSLIESISNGISNAVMKTDVASLDNSSDIKKKALKSLTKKSMSTAKSVLKDENVNLGKLANTITKAAVSGIEKPDANMEDTLSFINFVMDGATSALVEIKQEEPDLDLTNPIKNLLTGTLSSIRQNSDNSSNLNIDNLSSELIKSTRSNFEKNDNSSDNFSFIEDIEFDFIPPILKRIFFKNDVGNEYSFFPDNETLFSYIGSGKNKDINDLITVDCQFRVIEIFDNQSNSLGKGDLIIELEESNLDNESLFDGISLYTQTNLVKLDIEAKSIGDNLSQVKIGLPSGRYDDCVGSDNQTATASINYGERFLFEISNFIQDLDGNRIDLGKDSIDRFFISASSPLNKDSTFLPLIQFAGTSSCIDENCPEKLVIAEIIMNVPYLDVSKLQWEVSEDCTEGSYTPIDNVSNQIANIGLYKEVISRVFIDGSKINSNKSCAKFDYDYQAYGIDCSENSFLCENIIEFFVDDQPNHNCTQNVSLVDNSSIQFECESQ